MENNNVNVSANANSGSSNNVNKYMVGETTWEAEVPNNKPFKKTEWMKLRQESNPNVIRVVTAPHAFIQHRYKDPENKNPKNYGYRIKCSKTLYGCCPICDQGDQPIQRWLMGILDRKNSNLYRVLEAGKILFFQIKKWNKKFGQISQFDLEVEVDESSPAQYYSTTPVFPFSPLTESDLKTIKDIDLESLKRQITPPEPMVVLKIWNSCRERDGLPPKTWVQPVAAAIANSTSTDTTTTSTPAKPSVKVDLQGDDDEFTFEPA